MAGTLYINQVNPGAVSGIRNRQWVDGMINSYKQQGYDPSQINAIAQDLSDNTGGVSFQEIQARLGDTGAPTGGGYYGGGGGGTAMQTVNLGDYIRQINDAYNALYGDITNLANERRGQLEKTYGKQFQDLSKAYEDTNQGLLNAYGARGLADSSYKNKGITRAGDTYKSDSENLRQGYNQNLADIGRFAQTTRSGFEAGQQAINRMNPIFVGSAADVQNAQNSLSGQLAQLQQQRAGLGTQSGYINQLNSIAPTQSQGPTQLQKQLQDLVGASAPAFAKNQIAGALIQQQGQEGQQNYWQDYFQKLLSSTGGA